MYFSSISYNQPLFRPPSEAFSLILQVSLGCSHNKCKFCEMYGTKSFKLRAFSEIEQEIYSLKNYAHKINKIFLADGDALAISTSKLKQILTLINANFPRTRRISCYAKPKDLAAKSVDELIELRNLGLSLVYTGIESGSDEVLKINDKGETFDSTVEGLLNAKKAGIKLSVMILNGIGGKKFSTIHAIKSAESVNIIQPEYLSTLVLSYPYGIEHYKMRLNSNFDELSASELLNEMRLFIENTNLENTIFRSDHVSNFLALKGVLGKDKESILEKIDFVLENTDFESLKAIDEEILRKKAL